MIVDDVQRFVQRRHHAVHERFDGAGTLAGDHHFAIRHLQLGGAVLRAVVAVAEIVVDQLVGPVFHQILVLQSRHDLRRSHLSVQPLGQRLHDLGELHQHRPRQRDAEVFLQHEANAALARLAIDAHRFLVRRADIGRIDRQVRHLPMPTIHPRHAFLDGVLVRAGEGGEDQIAGIGMAFVDGQLVDGLHGAPDARHFTKVQFRVDALREQIHRHGDDVAVAGAFAVAEQRPFHPLGAGQQRQLRGCHAGAAIVVGVNADDDAIALRKVPAEPLDLIRVDIRRCHLHRGRQVDDDGRLRGRAPFVGHGGGDFDREVQLRAGETLRRVLELHVGASELLDALLHGRRSLHRQIDDASAVHVEDHATLQFGGGVVEVEDGVGSALQGFNRALDEFGARLAEHLDGRLLRHHAGVDDLANEIEIRLRCRREANFDFHEAHLQQQFVQPQLFVHVHGIDERLIAVAQIHAAPARRRHQGLARPLPLRQRHRRERLILRERHGAFATSGSGLLYLLRVRHWRR